jgi:Serine hydrolase (FSH1)
MACRSDLFFGLKFVILAGAPNIEDLHFPASKKFSTMACSATTQAKLSIRSLHFAGLSDAVVLTESSSALASRFESPLYIEHPQGHCIPTKPHFISIISEFLESQLLSSMNITSDIGFSGISNQCAKQERPSEGNYHL